MRADLLNELRFDAEIFISRRTCLPNGAVFVQEEVPLFCALCYVEKIFRGEGTVENGADQLHWLYTRFGFVKLEIMNWFMRIDDARRAVNQFSCERGTSPPGCH